MYFLKKRVILTNLLVMTYMWAACSFAYYMILIYLKYLPGSIYVNTISSALSENIAGILAGSVYGKLGV